MLSSVGRKPPFFFFFFFYSNLFIENRTSAPGAVFPVKHCGEIMNNRFQSIERLKYTSGIHLY